jgi:hypothetical protein
VRRGGGIARFAKKHGHRYRFVVGA